eukprot:TRINITY_DN11109_c0_g1_i1.p1 TRINITY_DN11109_c0_g1~~TRINITY_DN11109_c0_g1_i1.p1  ORF type:complete len:374 (+),score=24.77 TRINITY_DN11109_c0_g1_i1:143-1264(+)
MRLLFRPANRHASCCVCAILTVVVVAGCSLSGACASNESNPDQDFQPTELSVQLHETARTLAHNLLESRGAEASPNSVVLLPDKTDGATIFALCGQNFPDLEQLAAKPVELIEVGKLAKAGVFYSALDSRVLVKRIRGEEADVLTKWSQSVLADDKTGKSQHVRCAGFRSTLLTPYLLSFSIWHPILLRRSAFVLMQNETDRLNNLHGYSVTHVYDIKPLPSNPSSLDMFLNDMKSDWGKDRPAIFVWHGWQAIRDLLLNDLDFLDSHNVVDYSLFIHVLSSRHRGIWRWFRAQVPSCATSPDHEIMICFRIVDYVTPMNLLRLTESAFKHHKFYEYRANVQTLFDCLANLRQTGCTEYEYRYTMKMDPPISS